MIERKFDYYADQKRRSQENQERLREFEIKHNYRSKVFEKSKLKILVLYPQSSEGPSSEVTDDLFLDFEFILKNYQIHNNCRVIAKRLKNEAMMTDVLTSEKVDSNFVIWSNHSVSYKQLENGVISLDLTADLNIDGRQNNFQALSIISTDLPTLQKLLEDLYGGEWFVDHRPIYGMP